MSGNVLMRNCTKNRSTEPTVKALSIQNYKWFCVGCSNLGPSIFDQMGGGELPDDTVLTCSRGSDRCDSFNF